MRRNDEARDTLHEMRDAKGFFIMAKKSPSEMSNLKSKISKPQSLRVLIVEDSESDTLLEIRELKKGGYDPVYERVETATVMKKSLKEKQWDIILCDYKMPKFNAPSAIALLKEINIDVPLIIVSGAIGEETAVECMRSGAHDYIMKTNLSRLCPAINRELMEAESRRKRKQAEQALRNEQIMLARTEGIAHVGSWEWNIATDTVTWSDELFRIFQRDPREGAPSFAEHPAFYHPDDMARLRQAVEVAAADGTPYELELRAIRKDGEIRVCVARGIAEMVLGARAVRLFGSLQDITERKRAEETLRESEDKYKKLIENIPDIIFTIDLEGKITFVSHRTKEILGYENEETISMNIFDFIPKEDQQRAIKNLQKGMKGEKIKHFQIPMIAKSGERLFFECSFSRIYKDGALVGAQGTAVDITERKRAAEALRESEERFRRLANATREGIIIHREGTIMDANESAAKIMGYSIEEIIGKNIITFIAPESIEPVMQKLSEGATHDLLFLELKVLRKDKSIFSAEALGRPIRYKNIDARVLAFRDITERKQAEKALRASEENFRLSLDNSPMGVRIANANGETFYANQAVLEMYGYESIEELKRTPLKERYTPESYADFQIRNKKRKRGEFGPSEYEISIVRKNGEIRDLQVYRKEIIWNGVREFQIIYRDITERKQAEDAMRKSEEKYRLVVENAKEAIFVAQDVKLVFSNRATVDMLGYSEEILKSKSFIDFIHPDDRNMVVDHHIRRLKGEEVPPVYSFRVISQDGTIIWVELNVAVITWKERPATLNFLNDITGRKQAEAQVRERMKELKALYSLAEMAQREDIIMVELYKEFTNILPKSWLYEEIACARLVIGESEFRTENFAESAWKQSAPITVNRKVVGKIDVGYLEERPEEDEGPFLKEERMLIDALAERLGNIIERKQAEEERQQSFERMRKALGATVQAISMTVEMKDPYTSGHQQRVSDLARSMAKEMDLLADRQEFIRTASAIHDIGKISIPSEILSKPTKLTDLEFNLIKTHSQSGYEILKDIEFPWPVADVVLQHHERMDGSGYPHGFKGDDILLEARILAVADVVEAISSHRPYRPALGIDIALEEISENKGILYDADAVDACLKLFREKGYQLKGT